MFSPQAESMPVVKVSSVGNGEERKICCPAPFSHEPTALKILEECDYSQKITLEMAKSGNGEGPYCLHFFSLLVELVLRGLKTVG